VAIDLTEIFRSLNEILPYLAKQKMRLDQERKIMQMYLNKRLTEYGALEEMGKRGRGEAFEKAIKLELIKTGRAGVEDLDIPLDELLYRLERAGITHPAIPTISPEVLEERRLPYRETMVDQAGALEAGEYLPAEKMGVATQLLGSERAMDLLKELGKTIAGREAREITRDKTKLGWAELGVKGEKLTKKQLEEKLKFFAKKEKVFVGQLESLEEEMGLTEDDPKAENLKTQIAEMRQNQLNTLDQLLGDLDKKKCDKIIAKLSAGKATIKGLEKNKEQFMKKENLTEAEYNYIRLNL